MSTHAHQQRYQGLAATVAAIGSIYDVPQQAFSVGDHHNNVGENTGSLAILGFAKANHLAPAQVMAMFAEAGEEVLADPGGTDHANIRAFMKHGLDGVTFENGWHGLELKPELKLITDAFPERASFTPVNAPHDVREAVERVINWLDSGHVRSAMKLGYGWVTNGSVKEAILLSFRLFDNYMMGVEPMRSYDKVRSKFAVWNTADFKNHGFRVVPPATARSGAFIAKNVVLMPSFVNIGAYVDEGSMVDTWATVGSCAQIGKNCHLSGGAGIGGVLEPVQASPTIIEDDCFIGARSEVVEGVVVERGSVLSMGCFIGQSTPIIDRESGVITYGRIPPYSVVIPGTIPMRGTYPGLQKPCVIIAKRVDATTRSKVGVNELLRGV